MATRKTKLKSKEGGDGANIWKRSTVSQKDEKCQAPVLGNANKTPKIKNENPQTKQHRLPQYSQLYARVAGEWELKSAYTHSGRKGRLPWIVNIWFRAEFSTVEVRKKENYNTPRKNNCQPGVLKNKSEFEKMNSTCHSCCWCICECSLFSSWLLLIHLWVFTVS